MGVLHDLCVGTNSRGAVVFLSTGVRVVAEAEFHPRWSVSMGMAPAQHHEARVSSRLAGTAGLEVAAGSRCRTDCRHLVGAASCADRIRGMGYRARSADVGGGARHTAPDLRYADQGSSDNQLQVGRFQSKVPQATPWPVDGQFGGMDHRLGGDLPSRADGEKNGRSVARRAFCDDAGHGCRRRTARQSSPRSGGDA